MRILPDARVIEKNLVRCDLSRATSSRNVRVDSSGVGKDEPNRRLDVRM